MSEKTQRFLTKLADKASTVFITGGGWLMIASLVLIFALILSQTFPLFRNPEALLEASTALIEGSGPTLDGITNEYRDYVAVATATGGLKVVDLATASVVKEISLPEAGGKAVTAVARTIRGALALGLEDGGILLLAPRWQTTFPEGKRTSEFFASVTATLAPDPQGRPVRILALSHPESGEAAVASSPAPDVLFLASAGGDEPGASPSSSDLSPLLGGEAVSALSFHDNGRLLEAGTVSGKVLSFDVADPKEPKALGAVRGPSRRPCAGDRSRFPDRRADADRGRREGARCRASAGSGARGAVKGRRSASRRRSLATRPASPPSRRRPAARRS